jgi:hypothetical protein
MRRIAIRDMALIIAALLGFHALFVAMPARLALPEPPLRLLPLTAPDCVTSVGAAMRPVLGGSPSVRPDAPAGPVRR